MYKPQQQQQQENKQNKRKRRPEDRCLWKPATTAAADPWSSLHNHYQNDNDDDGNDESYESVLQHFSSRPRHKSWTELCSNALVVVQEVALTCFFLVRHDLVARMEDSITKSKQQQQQNVASFTTLQAQLRLDQSTFFLSLALLIVLFFSHQSQQQQQQQQSRKAKIRQRGVDGLLLAVLLRFLASLLRSLTASYSSDTVQALARAGMLLHVVACDYTYANGGARKKRQRTKMDPLDNSAQPPSLSPHPSSSSLYRPPFQGGTVSLTAALFSTTLLVSRLSSNLSAYFFLSLAVVTFAFYPVTRSALAAAYPAQSSPVLWVVTALICLATAVLLCEGHGDEDRRFTMQMFHDSRLGWFVALIVFLGFIVPGWKYLIQRRKRLVHGPWDLPTASTMQLDYHWSPTAEQ